MNHLDSICSLNSRPNDYWAHRPPKVSLHHNCFVYVLDHGLDLSHNEFIKSNITILLADCANSFKKEHATKTVGLICGGTLGVAPNSFVFYVSTDPDHDDKLIHSLHILLEHRKKHIDKIGIILCPWVINNLDSNDCLHSIFDNLENVNSLFVVSSGNYGKTENMQFPASRNTKNTLVVGSYDIDGMISLFCGKSHKKMPDVFSPGRQITVPFGTIDGYIESSGTTLAAAIVAGALTYYSEKDANYTKYSFLSNCRKNTMTWKLEESEFINYKTNSVYIGENYNKNVLPKMIKVNDIGYIVANTTDDYEYYFNFDLDKFVPIAESYKQTVTTELQKYSFNNPIIPLSGGLDSEWCLATTLDANLNPLVITMRFWYEDRLINNKDLDDAMKLYKKYNLKKTKIIDLDLKDFFENGKFFHYNTRYYCNSPQLCTHLWLMDQVDGDFIFAGDIPAVIDNDKALLPSLRYFSYNYYFYKNKKNGIGSLHMLNSQVFNHGLLLVKQLTTHGLLGSEEVKYNRKKEFYKNAGYPNLLEREKKLTGFEQIKLFYKNKFGGWRYFDNRFRFQQ